MNKDKTIKFLEGLISTVKHFYYDYSGEIEYLYGYIENAGVTLKFSSPKINGIKVSIVYTEKTRTTKELESSFFIKDWTQLKPALDNIINTLAIEKNVMMVDSEGLEFHDKYIGLTKEILKGQKEFENYELKFIKNSQGTDIEIEDKINGVEHTILLAKAFNEDKNHINSLLGCVEISIIVDTKIPLSFSNNTKRVITLLIPGYELNQYPVLTNKIKDPMIKEDIDSWITELKDLPLEQNNRLKTIIQYIELNEQMPINETKKQKIKI